MRSFYVSFVAVIFILLGSPDMISAQKRMFFVVGYGMEGYKNTDAVALAVDYYNQYNLSLKYIPDEELQSPGNFGGMLLGIKTQLGRGGMSFGLHWAGFKSTASGTDSTLSGEYFKKIKVGNVGVSVGGIWHLINSEGFRSGPALALNIEKFRMYCRSAIDYGTAAYEKPVDKFMMGLTLRWPLSFGSGKFNFDVIPYYTLPFWKVDAAPFYDELNPGHSGSFTAEQMTLKPVRWGVALTLNFGFMEEED
jgi:hypothetical protein